MTQTPNTVTLIEVGLRDGLQLETKIVPTPLKTELIGELAAAGFRHIQVTAFVHPARVPQMADAESLVAALPRLPDVEYNALVLNPRGLERALAAGLTSVEISVSASDTHSFKNAGTNSKTALKAAVEMIAVAKANACRVRAGIQCAFGCPYEGKIGLRNVLEMIARYLTAGVDLLAVADTTGVATPETTITLLSALQPLSGNVPIVLHLHDTAGRGLDNLKAALGCGVTHFDTAIAGLGGCPFVPNAPGNIDTGKTLALLHGLNIETGIDERRVKGCSERMLSFLRAE